MGFFSHDQDLADILDRGAAPLDCDHAFDPILAASRQSRYILIGEATHGTREFYRIRADITRRLIEAGLCDAVAVEADWPDAWRVNRYVTGKSDDASAAQALGDFERFPQWMWRNREVEDFTAWLADYNRCERKNAFPCGFYGLDLYSMNGSIAAVLAYLDRIDPIEAARARGRYACFGGFHADPQDYGFAAASGAMDACEDEAVAQLLALQRKARAYIGQDGDEYFSAQQNAEIVRKAEEYYRALYRGDRNTWNLRDTHMFETLERLSGYLSLRREREARIVVWAHNSHVGNAAATEMGRRGEVNLGSLAIEKHGRGNVINIGFSTSRGTVTAAGDWDGEGEVKTLNPPASGSYEALFSRMSEKNFMLDLRGIDALAGDERLQRAVGVLYRPRTERHSHYFYATLKDQFDFMIHLDETRALSAHVDAPRHMPRDIDETYPFGL